MIVSVECNNGKQLASVTTFNQAASGNAIEQNIRNHKFPILCSDIIAGLRAAKEELGLGNAKVYFKSDHEMRFNDPGTKI